MKRYSTSHASDSLTSGKGALLVLEGADGVGKTTLSELLCERLVSDGIPTVSYAFPGCTGDSLGRLVYNLHHGPQDYFPGGVNPLSLQMLHVAAHIDCIEGEILPALRSGKTVILDRFWLSTKIYGLAAGLPASTLENLLEIEHACWDGVTARKIFIVRRNLPLKESANEHWFHIRSLYDEFLSENVGNEAVVRVNNESSLQASLSFISTSLFGSSNA